MAATCVVLATASGRPVASAGMFQITQCDQVSTISLSGIASTLRSSRSWSLPITRAMLTVPSGMPVQSSGGEVLSYVTTLV